MRLYDKYEKEHVDNYNAYILKLKNDPKQLWSRNISNEEYIQYFEKVAKEGLVLDGVHITIQKTGLSYDYIAYKNKMLLVYPESKVDVSLVYQDDEFSVEKDSGKVIYSHIIKNPFNQDYKNIVGGYCVIKNKRGEFLVTLSKEEIEKHRKVAKTDYIWANWPKEMSLKTVIKKACKQHFADIYETIESEDNKQNDINNAIDVELKWKQEVEKITTVEELKAYYIKNKGRGKDFDKLIMQRKLQLNQNENENT